ncbi:MAG: O-antigen ligase family protein [Gammaproteobacteria bacterium]|nr:O-antigen ligase family protein [Gammaproteobacteria bacterium]
MPENMRAYVVVATIALIMLFFVRRSAGFFISATDFRRWVLLWFVVTTVGFFMPNFWLMAATNATVVLIALSQERIKPALFLLLLAALPMIGVDIPGFGIINYIFTINYQLMLSLVILLPLMLFTRRQDGHKGVSLEDVLLLTYLLLIFLLNLRETTITDSMRRSFLFFLTGVLPFFVLSRYVATPTAIRRVILAFLIPVFIYAPIGVFEMVKYWSLYASAVANWDLSISAYLPRAGLLRAVGPAVPHGPIVFGSLFVVAAGFMIALSRGRVAAERFWFGKVTIWSGLLSSLSRGPWVAAAVVYLLYWMTGPDKVTRAVRYGLPVLVLALMLLVTPFGAKIWGLLPFIGNLADETVSYREQVWNVSTDVIAKYPLFGNVQWRDLPEMQVLVQGQGIIDIVNTYVGQALEYGLVGLALFVSFFFVVLRRLRRAYRRAGLDRAEEAHTARALFATMAGLLVMIATVSSVGLIPWLYWSVAGLCVAQTRMLQREPVTEKTSTRARTHARRRVVGGA